MNSKEIVTQIVQWLINYSNKSKTSGYVVGVSGGIDSALTSTLCAMTGLPTLCVDMPISQNKNEQKRGLDHIKWLKIKHNNVKSVTIDLSKTFESFKKSVEKKFIVFTGGEPLLQLDLPLINELKKHKYKIAIETNGTIMPPQGIDWICMSPKAGAKTILKAR